MVNIWEPQHEHVISKSVLKGTALDVSFLEEPGPEVLKLFSCSTQLSMKFIMLISVKMPTIVGILTFMSMINTTSEHVKARKVFIFKQFRF